ncbi:MAG: YbaN family protein, partial [Candidatus Latescibacterota bacterium]|nr:YbaN family protein [Candidatus Latescibacterota bacterium]
AAWCFARSSPRFYRLLLGNRWLGPYIRNYREGRGLTMAAKVSTLVVLWRALAATVWFIAPQPWARVVLIAIATGVTIYLLRLPPPQPRQARHAPKPALRLRQTGTETDPA